MVSKILKLVVALLALWVMSKRFLPDVEQQYLLDVHPYLVTLYGQNVDKQNAHVMILAITLAVLIMALEAARWLTLGTQEAFDYVGQLLTAAIGRYSNNRIKRQKEKT